MRRIALIAAAALGLAAQAWAAPSRLYEVDVLVFANHLPKLDGNEHWNQEKITHIAGFKKALAPSHGLPEGSQLAIAQSILARHPHYTILAARSWVQDAIALHKTKPVRITSRRYGRLKGVIRVFQWRLMHVALDLHYTPPGATQSSSPTVYQLVESRPVALRATNYFDHPKFGVLVRVVPYTGSVNTPH
ncbi:CsiV family protein [Acidiferrobacter sp.]|uniref:CsiV family protein n=1 Tax=Acidiferrobacter sp. TaxID=1872107 RepID=UPI00261F81C4|nr:CsiV family protein [Acidiferrobacter sp.]